MRYLLASFLLAMGAVAAYGIDLGTAKDQGLVGERADGYLGLVDESAADPVRALVSDVNGKRRAQYRRIADANGISLAEVEALAGKKAIQRSDPGDWIFHSSWTRK